MLWPLARRIEASGRPLVQANLIRKHARPFQNALAAGTRIEARGRPLVQANLIRMHAIPFQKLTECLRVSGFTAGRNQKSPSMSGKLAPQISHPGWPTQGTGCPQQSLPPKKPTQQGRASAALTRQDARSRACPSLNCLH